MSPRITRHPHNIKDAVPGKPVMFTVQADGTGPLSYQWCWKPAEVEGGSEEWQQCNVENSDSASLTITHVHKSNEGRYRCVVSNIAGTLTSEPVKLSIGESPYINCLCIKNHNHILLLPHVALPPRITRHPHNIKDAVPGKPVMFTVQADGTGPLSYQWWWKPAEEEGGSEEWQQCNVENSDSASLTITHVHKSNEGRYRCVVSNIAGTLTSEPVKLSIGESPYINCLCIRKL